MTNFKLTLFSDQLGPGQVLALHDGPTVGFVSRGSIEIRGSNSVVTRYDSPTAFVSWSPCDVSCGDGGATVDRWMVLRDGEVPMGDPLLAESIEVTGDQPFLLRCDEVHFPPHGVAYLHTHAGPGIRRLTMGGLQVDTDGRSNTYAVGDPWFESGPIAVYARASSDGAAFVRVMVLPAEYQGRSSIRYVLEEDRDRPKPQRYIVHVDEVGNYDSFN